MRQAAAILWSRWKVIARRLGDFQARALLWVFYYAVLGPFALGVKTWSDPLRLRAAGRSGWLERAVPGGDPLRNARRQF